MDNLPPSQFQGFRSPNTTPVPDEFFDELLPVLSGAEVKVVLYICRRTFGWKKESDNISLNQMLHGITKKDGAQLDQGVGLSKPTLLRSLKTLAEKRIIIAEQRDSKEKGHEPTNYRLHLIDPLGQKTTLGVSQNFTKPLVKKVYQEQETVIQETGNKTVNVNGDEIIEEKNKTPAGDESLFARLPDLEQSPERTTYMAQELLNTLGDKHSARFYALVARKIPDPVIRTALAEIKAGEAKSPVRLFTFKMKKYALQHRP